MSQKKYCNLFAIVTICTFSLLTAVLAAEIEPAASPYRPTVSNPAELSLPGWLEMEFGTQQIKGGDNKLRESYPVLAKLAFTEDWGLLVGSEMAVKRTDTSDMVFSGNGDTLFVIKHRFPTATEGTAWGVEAGYKSPTANDTIGSGQADYLVNGIYSTEMAGHHLDLNLGATKIGGINDGTGEYQYNWAASGSRSLNDKLGLFAELSGVMRQGTQAQAQLMAGASYNYSKRVVFDAGASAGLTQGAQEWSVFAGITALLGKLW